MKRNEIILEVKNLSVELEGEKIIYNLSFKLRRGEIITILGPNGAGKTVLLKTLLGYFPFSGNIKWKEGIKIGYVPQRLPSFKEIPITVEEFFKLKKCEEKEIKNITELFEIKELLEKNINNLSFGEFQRVLVAFALLGKPDVLLFDEPTSGIDIKNASSIYKILKELKKKEKLSAILVTHDLSIVNRISDYVICLNKCPVCKGKPKDILIPSELKKVYKTEIKFYKHYHEH